MVMKRPIYPIHPGAILKDELDELQITPAALARDISVPPNRLYQLIAGNRAMTADTALRLQRWFGISASFWMNLQSSYELDCAEECDHDEIQRTVRVGEHLLSRELKQVKNSRALKAQAKPRSKQSTSLIRSL